jgi:class 3 adenylate cyclase
MKPIIEALRMFMILALPYFRSKDRLRACGLLAAVVGADRLSDLAVLRARGETPPAAELGDAEWRSLLEAHHALVRRQLARHRGRELDTAGDGFFATFDGPARAIRCASAITNAVSDLGVSVRAGLHTGECQVVDGKIGGIAVHIGARVTAQATAGEVLVSGTVKDLVAGSGIHFQDRGVHELKGVPGNWHLFSVVND